MSFGGADTANHYSLDAHTDRVEIFLKKKACCDMDWQDFTGTVVLICHGAAGSLESVESSAASLANEGAPASLELQDIQELESEV